MLMPGDQLGSARVVGVGWRGVWKQLELTDAKKGVNYFPSRANDQFEEDVTDKRLVNSVKYYYLSLRLV